MTTLRQKDRDLKRLISEACAQRNATMIELAVMPDHVHLLVDVDPQFGVHRLIKEIKGRSSRVLRSQFPWLRRRLPSLWTNNYFVSTVDGAPLAIVK